MNPLIQLRTTTLPFLIAFVLACFGLSPAAQGVSPAPDGGYPNGNTAEGNFALQFLTIGTFNTALGNFALFSDTAGLQNTATGAGALFKNTGNDNTATGVAALFNNTLGTHNTATGLGALFSNIDASDNTAVGWEALASNDFGNRNTAVGSQVLLNNTEGVDNTAVGFNALASNIDASDNTAVGWQALFNNNINGSNTAVGESALFSNTGAGNIGLGAGAGHNLTTGNFNIDIGNAGGAAEANTIRIGAQGTQQTTFIAGISGANEGSPTAVFINTTTGQLGTTPPASSRRFKKEIKPMDQTSEAILGLKPVTFHYKSDSKGTPQFGLIAEEVAQVNPDLVVRDDKGEIYTVRYEAVNAMLLNEFLKEHQKVEEQRCKVQEEEATIAQLKQDFQSKFAEQQKQIKALSTGLQKVNNQLELSKPAPQMVGNDQ